MKKIIFFGSSTEFSPLVLQKLVDSDQLSVISVVTTEDKPVGRHLVMTSNPVKVLAQKLNIPVYDNIKDFLMTTNDYSMTIGIIAAYGKIIGPKTLSRFNGQIYGIHPSLLPKYRGPSPLQQQILDGITDIGVTIFKIDLGEDTGPIVATVPDKILPTDNKITLGERLFSKGADLIISNIQDLTSKISEPQNNNEATHTHKFTKQDGFIPWDLRSNIQDLRTKQRAFYPWPGVWTINPKGERLKL